MTGIWMENVGGWSLQSPQAFENEKALHDMVLGTPELLPLSGSPRLTVIGREVMVSTGGRVDVLAVEPDGRPVLIEVKLRNNSESRRAVIAQALSYAAALHGVAYEDFESMVRTWLPSGLHEAVRGAVQDEALEVADFEAASAEHLANGTFRVVIVLDEAPAELIGLVGYLEAVTVGVSIDLITVSAYQIGPHRIAVPQRLEPGHRPQPVLPTRTSKPKSAGVLVEGAQAFRDAIADSPGEHDVTLLRMCDWAESLDHGGDLVLETYLGKGTLTLLPRFLPERTGLASLYRWSDGKPMIQLWRSVFERRAPGHIDAIERITGKPIGQPSATHNVSEELLSALAAAYRDGSRSGVPVNSEVPS